MKSCFVSGAVNCSHAVVIKLQRKDPRDHRSIQHNHNVIIISTPSLPLPTPPQDSFEWKREGVCVGGGELFTPLSPSLVIDVILVNHLLHIAHATVTWLCFTVSLLRIFRRLLFAKKQVSNNVKTFFADVCRDIFASCRACKRVIKACELVCFSSMAILCYFLYCFLYCCSWVSILLLFVASPFGFVSIM